MVSVTGPWSGRSTRGLTRQLLAVGMTTDQSRSAAPHHHHSRRTVSPLTWSAKVALSPLINALWPGGRIVARHRPARRADLTPAAPPARSWPEVASRGDHRSSCRADVHFSADFVGVG